MLRHALTAAFTLALVSPGLAHADQLLCNSLKVARAAAKQVKPGSLVLDYCSNCGAPIKVVRVEKAEPVMGCEFELRVTGKLLAESEAISKPKRYKPSRVRFSKASGAYSARVDLAYFYVMARPNRFITLGEQLKLKAEVDLPRLRLPASLYKQLSGEAAKTEPGEARPKYKPVLSKIAPPKSEAVHAVTHHWRNGKRPVLGQLKACLELDMDKSSPSRYECKTPVTGPVPVGTPVYAWSEWLVPRGLKRSRGLRIEILYGGKIRLSEPVTLTGRPASPIVRSTLRAVLSHKKTYTLRLTERGRPLASVDVKVR